MTNDGRLFRLSAVKLALLAAQTREEGSELSLLRAEPIAIVGLGCRFPLGETPDEFWQTLHDGRDAISEVPPDRWDWKQFHDADPAARGKMTSRWGGFLRSVDGFDASFFGMSPREAANLDPQQRLFLEVAHEALDDAGLVRVRLAGQRVGVFVASYHNDYAFEQYRALETIDAYTGTGTSHSILANRLSYMLDLRGPSVSIDTACSASLVAVHVACESLRSGESSIALAGGVGLMLTPAVSVGLSKWGFLAPDGRCKAFDARANGFVRGEGCGVVVLKRLADALADHDVIYGLVRGSAVNQDGRTAVLTAPSGLAQQAVVREALNNGAVLPDQVSYVEAHGTGTALGDPIEVEALAEVFGEREPDRRIVLGAVKTNIGHLEAAAGVAGLIKVLLAMRYGVIPPNLHFTALNPNIEFGLNRFEIPIVPRPWPRGELPRIAGVSSFGFGGTNAHVVLEEPPASSAPRIMHAAPDSSRTSPVDINKETDSEPLPKAHLLALSAQSDNALAALAARYSKLVRANADAIDKICYSAALHRDHFEYRAAVVGSTAKSLVGGLDALARGELPANGSRGRVAAGDLPRIAFVFSGQGPQWWAMGRELRSEPAFAQALATCASALAPHIDWSLLAELDRSEDASRLDETEVAQPAIFAIQVAVAALLDSWGIGPEAVVGHSVGEIAAAHFAGALSLAEAARLVVHRGRIMQEATGLGRMAAVDLSEADATAILREHNGLLSVAAVNAARSCVLSGDQNALNAALAQLARRGIGSRMLPVNYAFHSSQMAPFERRLTDAIRDLVASRATIPIISTVTAKTIDGSSLDAQYWGRNLRETVRFGAAIEEVIASGIDCFIEIAPHPVVSTSIASICEEQGATAKVLATLRRGRPERQSLLGCAAVLYTSGSSVNWTGLFPHGGTRVSLPAYPWQRTRHWIKVNAPVQQQGAGHPLLGRRIDSAALRGPLFETRISSVLPGFLQDHVIAGAVIVPATAYVEMALSAASASNSTSLSVRGLSLKEPLALMDGEERVLQCVTASNAEGLDFEILSAPVQTSTHRHNWTLHASGSVVSADVQPSRLELDAICSRCAELIPAEKLYEQFAEREIHFGPSFRGIHQVRRGESEVLAEIVAPDGTAIQKDYAVHPALLDACLQALLAIVPHNGAGKAPTLLIPRSCDFLTVVGKIRSSRVWSHAALRAERDAGSLIADVVIADEHGTIVARIGGLRLVRTSPHALGIHRNRGSEELYCTEWRTSIEAAPIKPGGAWLILGDQAGIGTVLADRLRAIGAIAVIATAGTELKNHGDQWTVRPTSSDDFARLLHDAAPADGWTGIVHLWNLDATASRSDPIAMLEHAALVGTGSTLHLVQALLRSEGTTARVYLISRGARAVSASQQSIAPSQAIQWGFARALQAEHPELPITRVDLDPAASADAEVVLREISRAAAIDREVAWRAGVRYVPRLAVLPAVASRRAVNVRGVDGSSTAPDIDRVSDVTVRGATEGQAEAGVRLVVGRGNLLEELSLQPLGSIAPGPKQIEISVEAAGLNFRDVLNAIGMAPGGPMSLGGECAGRVRRIGAGVSGFAVGDCVMAFAAGSFASRVVVDAGRAIAVPHGVTMPEAAGIPVAFLTAMYALSTLAQLQRGERVLVHAGAGGVGMAAIQVALLAGAEVFATAGTPAKRKLLTDLGVAHVMDSRTLDFMREIHRITGGEGVHVVLNSLAGEFIAKSLEATARGGRFIELGKRGIWSADEIARVRPDVTYMPFDLADVAINDPKQISALFSELVTAVESGALRVLPTRTWPLSDAVSAFRTMAQARHTGKLVLLHPGADAGFRELRRDGTYLITGGLGALGLATAQRMVERGAGRIVLVSRGEPGAGALVAIAAMRAAGATVLVRAADVSNEKDVGGLFRDIELATAPLRGIIHAAGIIDDGVVIEQTWPRVARVLAPKMIGAFLLARYARDLPLDFFICYSSATGVFGSPGQSSYSAANSYLDAFCQALRLAGVPATSVQWGAWRDIGMAARQAAQHSARLVAKGIRPMATDRALSALDRAIETEVPTVAVVSADWKTVATQSNVSSEALLSELFHAAAPSAAAPVATSILPKLKVGAAARRSSLLFEHIRTLVVRLLGFEDSAIIEAERPLRELGLDSLVAVELRNALAASLQCSLPSTLAFDYPTISALARHLEQRLFPAEAVAIEPLPPQDSATIHDLSDEDAEAMLLAELDAGKP